MTASKQIWFPSPVAMLNPVLPMRNCQAFNESNPTRSAPMHKRRPARYLTSRRAHRETMAKLEHMHQHQLEILERIEKMAGEIELVLEEVTEIKGKVASMAALLNKLSKLIKDNATNPAALRQIAADLDAASQEAQAAIDANDPDVPPPPPTDPVP